MHSLNRDPALYLGSLVSDRLAAPFCPLLWYTCLQRPSRGPSPGHTSTGGQWTLPAFDNHDIGYLKIITQAKHVDCRKAKQEKNIIARQPHVCNKNWVLKKLYFY